MARLRMDRAIILLPPYDFMVCMGKIEHFYILRQHLLFQWHAVAQLVEALSYKSEGRGFDSRWCHWIFHWHNPSGRTMVLGSTQPLTEMSTRNVSWGQRRPVRRADNLNTFMCPLPWNLGASISWKAQGLFRPVMGLLYLFFITTHEIGG